MITANNNFNLVGNITRNPEVKLTTNQTKYTFITLAVNKPTKDSKPDFCSVIFFDNLADNIKKYVKKGDCLAVCGTIGTRRKDEGTSYLLVGESFTFCRGRRAEEPKQEPKEPKEVNPENDKFEPVNDPFAPF